MNYDKHGIRVKAVHFAVDNSVIDDNETVPPGTLGMIDDIDDGKTVHVYWDNGCRLGMIPDRDQWLEDVTDTPIKMREYKYTPANGTYERLIEGQDNKQTAFCWTLHLSLNSPDDLEAVLDRLSQVEGCGLTGEYSTGDSWRQWGETPDDDTDHALHVYFRATKEKAAERGMHLANHAFFSHGAAIPYAVSTAGDWAEQLS